MKSRLAVAAVFLISLTAFAQKKEEKPKVHADFQFGSYPYSRSAAESMSAEQARLVMVAYHEGWSIDKLAKTLKLSAGELSKVSDKLEDEKLLGRPQGDDYDIRPFLPVIRERDWDHVKDSIQQNAQDFSKLLQSRWTEIEAMVGSLDGSKSVPKERVMYETVVSGILFGGMMDAFYEDKTMIPPPPRRGKNGSDRFYAWLVESNPEAAGKLKRELRESAGYRIISIGTELPSERIEAEDLRNNGTVYADADARKYRAFIGVFTRDRLLPFFKSRREDYLKQGAFMSSGRYVAFGDFFAWYYNTMANAVVDDLIAAHRIAPPEKYYTYAIRVP